MNVEPDHPKQTLLFYINTDIKKSDIDDMAFLVERIASGRSWIIGPPKFVYEVEESENPEDTIPIITLGGFLELYSARPPYQLPHEINLAHYKEVKQIVEHLKIFSCETGHEIEFEFDGELIGRIEDGEPDEGIVIGLLGEWERVLQKTL